MRILVVDDDFISLTKLKALLSIKGDCQAATNGAQAIEMFIEAHAAGKPYDLITMDIEMPGMTGYEAVEAIRAWEKENRIFMDGSEVAVLMVTVKSDSGNFISSFKSGCEGYIIKPFDRAAIEKAVDQVMHE
ncbi:MAG: response regulator [Candidatus Wallbacteria bacterium HGW-Wallbacteria-1]|jgi:two-component system chemotaxis response regulator CheY|uniref:Response regulator n=1 Tax=Candidatus Wallbacteria bacterium HGW-Wallbacteria-1 TaxID=2013854 RepID=A0A2N1PJ23_9BACT|nr:MAG: response regulator [Candidatus Wallbacteria bacterium HGW-Wallbacteria-1]